MVQDIFEKLNSTYEPLYKYAVNLVKELRKLNYDVEWGYYGLHSIKRNDEFITEFFPIPVVTVKNICDIGIDLNSIFIETKLKSDDAINFDYLLLKEYSFEVYGIDNYLNDFYNKSLDIIKIPERIKKSGEKEIGIQILLKSNSPFSKIIEFVEKLNGWNTYI